MKVGPLLLKAAKIACHSVRLESRYHSKYRQWYSFSNSLQGQLLSPSIMKSLLGSEPFSAVTDLSTYFLHLPFVVCIAYYSGPSGKEVRDPVWVCDFSLYIQDQLVRPPEYPNTVWFFQAVNSQYGERPNMAVYSVHIRSTRTTLEQPNEKNWRSFHWYSCVSE